MQERPNSYERMPFLKLYSREWLHGSLRVQNDAAERGVWTDFLALANESRNRGVIQANDETPYPHSYLAAALNIPLELLERCIQKFTEQERIAENENGILVVNFSYWQGLDTHRGRGRPSKQRRGRVFRDGLSEEELLEAESEAEFRNTIAAAKMDKRKELGRELTNDETKALFDKVKEDFYGK